MNQERQCVFVISEDVCKERTGVMNQERQCLYVISKDVYKERTDVMNQDRKDASLSLPMFTKKGRV